MNLKHISDAVSGIDTRFISESMEQPVISAKNSTARKPFRVMATVAAAVCLVLALSITAYALNISGIRDLLGHTYAELSPEADQYIVPHSQVIEGEYWTCRVTESLTAGGTVMVSLNITCDDDYILNGCMDIPSNEEIAQGIGSFAYAEEQGKTPLFVGAHLTSDDGAFSGYATSLDEYVSDNEMNILIQRDKLTVDPFSEAICSLDVREIRLENGVKVYDETTTTSFTIELSEAPVLESVSYLPVDGGSVPGLTFEEAVIDRTVVGDIVTLTAAITDEQYIDNVKFLRCDNISEFFNFHTWTENGKFFWRWTIAEIDAADTLTVFAYDHPDNECIGEVSFAQG